MRKRYSGILATVCCASLALPVVANADGLFGDLFQNMTITTGAFVRVEGTFKTSAQTNPNNQTGNPFNGVPEVQQLYIPPNAVQSVGAGTLTLIPALGNSTLVNSLLNGTGGIIPISTTAALVGNWDTPVPGQTKTRVRPVRQGNNIMNMHILRAEGTMDIGITSNLKFRSRLRLIGDIGHYGGTFHADTINDFPGIPGDAVPRGITGGDNAVYGGAPNYFQYRTVGDNHPLPLEWDGPNYEAYFPAAFLEYTADSLNVRFGEQQIAWGNAIFFRVFDTANGLDLRRHSLLDYAQEEFSDKRVPAPALRVSWQTTQDLLFDGYVEKFQPSILGNANTPYNPVPSQFTVHDYYSNYENKINYALRMQWNNGDYSFEAFAGRRYNPWGAFAWTASGVSQNNFEQIPDANRNLGQTLEVVSNAGRGGTGGQLAGEPFSLEPGGVYSDKEYFHYAALARLNGVAGLNNAANQFQPYTGNLFVSPVNNFEQASHELQSFFYLSNSLRGHVQRQYFQEYNMGVGAGYTTHAAPGSLLDQVLIHVEIRYTPDRTLTDPGLSVNYLRTNDWVGALVMEKWLRYTQAFPAAYIVFQYMHRTRTDLFGRSFKGYGGTDTMASPGVAGGGNYFVLAVQQPIPRDIVRFAIAILGDTRGSILVQPGFKWHVNHAVELDAFYTYINARLGTNPNSTLLGGLQYANEATVRLSYQFGH